MRRSTEERFWTKVNKNGPISSLVGTPCWIWTAHVNKKGYGVFKVDGKVNKAHRVSWMLDWRPLPKLLDHKCLVKACVNPDHLRAATNKENQEHRSGANSNNRSNTRGVTLNRKCQKWMVRAQSDKQSYYGGLFPKNQLAEATAAVVVLRNKVMTYNDVDRD